MRTEQEIKADIEVYEKALEIETDPWARQVFVGRVCALQWVLFEPREMGAKRRYYDSMIEAARKSQEELGSTRADIYWGTRGV